MKEPYFINRYVKLISEFKKECIWQSEIISWILSLIWFIMLPFLLIFLWEYFQFSEWVLLSTFFVWIPILGYFWTKIIYRNLSKILIYLLIRKERKLLQYLKEIFSLISNDISKIQTIDEILEKIDAIRKLGWTLQTIQKKISNISDYRKQFWWLIDESIEWILQILTNLRSDLSIRLTEQQSTLKSAKSEVEKNITWTTELNQVSELQKARLDRQIEQFEELKRVLVKV